MNDEAIEQAVHAKGLTAARITPADIAACIASEFYFTAAQGVLGASDMGTAPAGRAKSLEHVTICVLVLRNGTKIVGVNEGPVSPTNFDPEIGRTLAREKATDQIWPLLGYELRSRLAGPTDAMVDRFLQWPVPAHVCPDGTPGLPGRTGTNLLDAIVAKDMLAHVLGG